MSESIYVIGTIKDGKSILGYKLFFVEKTSVLNADMKTIEGVCSRNPDPFLNAKWDKDYKGLVSKCSISLSSLPVSNIKHIILGRKGIGVIKYIADANDNLIGCVAIDSYGMIAKITFDKLLHLLKNYTPINFELKSQKEGTPIPVPICGETWEVLKVETYKKSSYNSGLGEKEVEPTEIPKIPVYSINDLKDSEFNIKAQTKMFKAMSTLKLMCPYYWVALSAIDRFPCTDEVTKTMCVTEDKMYYNLEFVASKSVPEIIFILIHELCHICMQHTIREGRDMIHSRWNIACDIYINEFICNEFDLQVGTVGKVNGEEIMPPADGYYVSKIGESLDLAKDIPEVIYKRLSSKQDQDNGQSDQGQGGQSGQNQSGQSQSGQSGQSQGQSQGSQGQGQQGGDDDSVEATESNDIYSDIANSNENSQGGTGEKQQTVYYNGKKLDGKYIADDLKSNTGLNTEDDTNKSVEQSIQKLQQIDTKKKMVESKTGVELTKQTSGAELLQRYINFGLSSDIDWRVVLKNMCKFKKKKMYTLASPNQDYMNMGITVAGRRNIGKNKVVKNIKICIDVSGSIDNATLNWCLSEVANIFTNLDVSGELLYWSTKVGDCCPFKTLKDLSNAEPLSTGGTDVSCVFDFLSGNSESMSGKKEKDKIRDILGVIIITDGHFNMNYSDYERAFANKTLWLVYNNICFDALFGRVLSLKRRN